MEKSQAFESALGHYQAGRLVQTEEICRQLLAAEPTYANAWHLLAFVATNTGRNDEAAECLERVTGIEPRNADAFSNLGGVLMQLQAFDKAEACFRRAIELQANCVAAWSNLARLLYDQRRLQEAIVCYQHASELNPLAFELHNSLGNALADAGMAQEAIAEYRRAIELKPDYAEAHNNLGSVLWTQGNLDEAVASLRRALEINPNFAEALAGLGNVLNDRGELEQAVASYQQAIALKPDLAAAYSNLGNTLKSQGKLGEAIGCLRRAIELSPTLHRAHSNLVYSLYFVPGYDAAGIYEEHRRWNEQHAKPLARFIRPHENDRSELRRLRVGYVSPDFRKHAQSLFTVPLFSSHDHEQFEIFCYSDTLRPDSVTSRIQKTVDIWRDIRGLNDHQVAELIRRDQIDLLVDLTMHMSFGRPLLFAMKPAPVQVCWLAYPGTTGLNTMDYRLTDPYLDPSGLDDRFYSETSIRLPAAFWCYDPVTNEPTVNSLPADRNGHITFGCLNNFFKVNEDVLRLWARVLQSVDRSRLLILTDRGSHHDRTLEILAQEGVAPDRVDFLGLRLRPQYLQLYHQIDICLDTFPYNGHTTSLDSFWMGVPVVTLAGQTASGRGGVSICSNLGLTELIAQTPEQFVSIAAALAGDLDRLQEMRRTLRERMRRSPLMDAPKFARNIESAYRAMWQRWCRHNSTCLEDSAAADQTSSV